MEWAWLGGGHTSNCVTDDKGWDVEWSMREG